MRFRPRFSIRTLAIFVTLVCAYFGVWEATKRYGVPETHPAALYENVPLPNSWIVWGGSSPMPFVVKEYEVGPGREGCCPTYYYLWLFGPKIKLPFESEW